MTPVGQLIDAGIDTLVVISFDSIRTSRGGPEEISGLDRFLGDLGNLLVVAPLHDIGDHPEAQFFHHDDRTLPREQRFGGYARSVLPGVGIPVRNRFGLRPTVGAADGQPAPSDADLDLDRLGLLAGVDTLNLHPHLPHLEREGEAVDKLDVLARQPIDVDAPPHPFVAEGNLTFDALLQSRPRVFAGTVIVSATTLFSSTAGGLDNLTRLWTNLLRREVPDS